MITMQVVEQSRAGHALVNGPSDSKPSVHVLLGVYLAVERADPSSTWQPYIRVLPASFAGSSPIKAPGWVFDEVLRGTAARDLIVLRRKEIRDEYQEIVRRTLPAVSFDQYEWGVLVSMTRAAAVTIDGQKTAALIPLLNEIRHSPASEATTTDRFVQNEHVVMATGRPVSPQLGLTRNYGHRPAQVYYVDYGFVPERPQPALDTFKVEFDPRDADDKDGRLRHLVGDWRRSWTLTSESPIDPGMAQVLRLLARNASERALPDATGRALISAGNEERARVALADAIRRKVGELRRVPPAPDDQHDVHQIEMAVAMRRLEADAAQRFLDRVLADAGQRLTTTTEAAPAPAAGAFVGEDPFDALRQWMEAGGADLSGVRVVHEDDAGQRGLRAHRPMSQGDVVISVPLSLIITSALAGDCDVAKEARRNGVDLETHALMAALLATSWAHDARDVAVGTPGATLSPYLSLFNATLPSLSSYESFLAQYYPTDLLAMLEGTRTLALVNGTRHVLDRDYDALRRAAPRSMANVSRRAYARARHLVDTRNFIVDVDRDANRTLNMMVPFVDMMNHGLAPNAFWAFDPDRAEFQVTAARSIADGDAIVTSYGIKSNGILLTVYGFALPDNPHDVAQMRFRLFPGTTPGRATATATTCTVPATTNDDAVWECVRKVQRGRTDLQVVDAIDEAAADALAMFAGSIDDDLRLLQRDRFDDDRQRSVVRVRLGEKRVLAYWRATAAVLRPYYAGQVSIDALPSDLADFVRQWQQQQQEAGRR
ncbi:hypothetical protein PBRA_009442 [Plasmodiophora brassicae]|nr:hypothetical protein PBRA_009442 [Plasmodiophora brassicae]